MFEIIKYLKYIARHKWYVLIECLRRGIFWRGVIHDISKLLPDEFFPYMNFFYRQNKFPNVLFDDKKEYKIPLYFGYELYCYTYTAKTKHDVKKDIDLAWLKHIHRNPHHWQFWILYDNGHKECLPMPNQYVREMVSDWIGAGKAITGKNDVLNWYEKNKDKIILHPDTRKLTEYYLGIS